MSEEKLPKGWEFKPLKDLNSGKSKNIDPAKFPEKTFELYSVPQFDFAEPEYPKGIEIKSTKQKVEVGDVLISKINPRINRVWVVEDFSRHEKIASSEWIIIRPRAFTDSKYLKYAASAPFFRSLLQSEVSGVGGSLTRARPKIVANYRIPVAPFPDQQRIVARLDAIFGHLDVLREKLDRIPELLKNFRQQVLTQAVTGELTKEWREGKDLGEWERKKLGEFSENRLGKMLDQAKNKGQLTDYLRNINIRWFVIDFSDLYQMRIEESELHKYELKYGDILVCEGGEPGRAAIWKNERSNVIFQKALHRIRLSEEVLPEYFLYNLFIDASTESLNELFTGTTIKHLTGKSFAKYEIDVPAIDEQKEIVKRVDSLFGLADKIESQYQSLKSKIDQLPQAVLAKAFRGELVEHEVKEYVREVEELGMVAEGKRNIM